MQPKRFVSIYALPPPWIINSYHEIVAQPELCFTVCCTSTETHDRMLDNLAMGKMTHP
jgi:hypothetical protein